jgi:hypothetical protein
MKRALDDLLNGQGPCDKRGFEDSSGGPPEPNHCAAHVFVLEIAF